MGIVHADATVSPTKLELAQAWVPTQPWGHGRTVTGKVAEYRFDDPDGEVGIETILWTLDDGSVAQVPFTYRGAPLEGAEGHLIDTMEHSVLGRRWIYDGCGDPVWATALATAVLTGGTQVQMFFERDGQRIDVPPRMRVQGSGSEATAPAIDRVVEARHDETTTTTRAGGLTLVVARIVGVDVAGDAVLTGRVGDDGEPHVLAAVSHG